MEKGKTLDDYDLKSVTFEQPGMDTVSFDSKPPRHASAEFLLILVKDVTIETNVLRCS